MDEVLRGLMRKVCLTWVDDIIIFRARDDVLLVRRVIMALGRLMDRGLFATAHKTVLYRKEVKWRGRIYTGIEVRYDLERVDALFRVHRPTMVRELWHFLQAINLMRTALPDLAKLGHLLRDMLKEVL